MNKFSKLLSSYSLSLKKIEQRCKTYDFYLHTQKSSAQLAIGYYI